MKLSKLGAKVATMDLRTVKQAEPDQMRGNSAARGYGYKWRKFRARYLRQHPLCVHCQRGGVIAEAEHLDHITPHRGDKTLFWRQSNVQGLCARHHGIKTAGEDGGFGNPVRQGEGPGGGIPMISNDCKRDLAPNSFADFAP